MLNIRTILVPADYSGHSEDAFQLAQALARDYGARLIVVHVATPPLLVTPGELGRALQVKNGYRAELEERLKGIYAIDFPGEIEHRILDGDPAVGILDTARQVQCDLIVMGTHGHTGLGRLLLGSVAEQIVRKADCPVLTVKVPAMHALVADSAHPEPARSPR